MGVIARIFQQIGRIFGFKRNHTGNRIAAIQTGCRAFNNFNGFQGLRINKIARRTNELVTRTFHSEALGQVNAIDSDFDVVSRHSANSETTHATTKTFTHLHARFVAHQVSDVLHHLVFDLLTVNNSYSTRNIFQLLFGTGCSDCDLIHQGGRNFFTG